MAENPQQPEQCCWKIVCWAPQVLVHKIKQNLCRDWCGIRSDIYHCTGLTRKLSLKFSICQLTYISILVYDHQLWIREAQISKGISVWYYFDTSQLITVQVFFILPNISILSAYLSYSWNSLLHDYLSFFNLVNGFSIC